jgi:hypothetical protein
LKKDEIELENQKQKIIKQLLEVNREDIVPKPPKKITLWQRIKKVILG